MHSLSILIASSGTFPSTDTDQSLFSSTENDQINRGVRRRRSIKRLTNFSVRTLQYFTIFLTFAAGRQLWLYMANDAQKITLHGDSSSRQSDVPIKTFLRVFQFPSYARMELPLVLLCSYLARLVIGLGSFSGESVKNSSWTGSWAYERYRQGQATNVWRLRGSKTLARINESSTDNVVVFLWFTVLGPRLSTFDSFPLLALW